MPKPTFTTDPDDLRRQFAARMEALGLSVYAVARDSGKLSDQASISRWLAGDIQPRLATVMRWMGPLGGSVGVRWGKP